MTRNDVNLQIRRIKQNYWERFLLNMEHDIYGIQKQMWRFVRSLKKEAKEIIVTQKISKQVWVEYITNLYEKSYNVQIEGYLPRRVNDEIIYLHNT